jgi:drug/metabolite transporter superfamily protein YnfA
MASVFLQALAVLVMRSARKMIGRFFAATMGLFISLSGYALWYRQRGFGKPEVTCCFFCLIGTDRCRVAHDWVIMVFGLLGQFSTAILAKVFKDILLFVGKLV